MPAYAVIGGQWGDEGKGKVIDYLAGNVDSSFAMLVEIMLGTLL